jgi:sulfatase maturation enzyme AslB (radical SAM superfamily)
MHPFTGLATRSDGAVMACCRSLPVGWIQDQTLEEIWNNENMKRIRRQVLNNERPAECAPCFNLEDQGVESLRQRHTAGVIPEARVNLYPDALDALDDDFSMPFEIPTMEIKLNNLCNLKCRMCHPMDSTSWNDYDKVEDFYVKENNYMVDEIRKLNLLKKPYLGEFENTDNWWASFEKLLPYFRRVEFAGGEPLMDPYHFKILDMLAPYGDNIEIKYATNGTKLGIKGGRTIHDYWPKFKSVAVNVSIDGIGDSYDYVRGNSDWDTLIENIKVMQTFPNISRIVGAVAVQVSNVLILDKMIKYFLDNLGIVFYTNMVNYPRVLCPQVLPQELKEEAIRRLEAVKLDVPNFKYVKENPILLGITLGQIDGIINFIRANDQSNLWKDCIAYNSALDKTRNQDFLATTPEFKPYV